MSFTSDISCFRVWILTDMSYRGDQQEDSTLQHDIELLKMVWWPHTQHTAHIVMI